MSEINISSVEGRGLNIFSKIIPFRPYQYPSLMAYKDAIRHSYWIHTEFNVNSDIQDFKVNISSSERSAISRTMLAISQVEVSVKTFWAKIYDKMPRPEIGAVGFTFAESEVRHADAYAFLLERLGLESDFDNIHNIPAIIDRVEYLGGSVRGLNGSEKDFTLSLLLFSVFIEHISLFSQFLVMMSFNKYRNQFKGISNIVEATSKEEDIHGKFGIELYQIIRKEFPEWFDEEFEAQVIRACNKAYKAEVKMLDWIFEEGELDFLPKGVIENFIKDRFNKSLGQLNIKEPQFTVDREMLKQVKWFDEEVLSTKDNDFFVKRGTTYSKKTKSITEDDLF